MAEHPLLRRSPLIGPVRVGAPGTAGTPAQPGGPVPPVPAGERIDVLIELNLRYPGGIVAVTAAFFARWDEVRGARGRRDDGVPEALQRVSVRLFQAVLTPAEAAELIAADRAGDASTIFRIWPDYPLYPQVDRSAPTVKIDACWRSFDAVGRGIVWAVVDSGIDAAHLHFAGLELATEPADGARTGGLHRDFGYLVAPSTADPIPAAAPLTDELGHGTHVAGIIAGRSPAGAVVASSEEPPGGAGFVPRTRTGQLSGMAPECELVSLKVMRRTSQGTWVTSAAAVIAALEYIRTEVNVSRAALRIHGINLSLGCDWDPKHYAAGQSPLCQAVDELVAAGVVVVVSAGNGGKADAEGGRQTVALMGSITEPGHAERCITVGSTHRDAPHVFGISWTSGKGPTLDGRAKPDVVAPGEWITSAATGSKAVSAGMAGVGPSAYAEDSGTSMAAPHVSGVVAAFLSVRPEYIGRPDEVKALVREHASDLGREPYAQGAGLVDGLRMLTES